MIKKIILFLLVLAIGTWYGYNKIFIYDANNPNSLEILLKITHPEKRVRFFKDFELAMNDEWGTNLHGLNRDEIISIANKKRLLHIDFLEKCIKELNTTSKKTISLNRYATRKLENPTLSRLYSKKDLEKIIRNLKARISKY